MRRMGALWVDMNVVPFLQQGLLTSVIIHFKYTLLKVTFGVFSFLVKPHELNVLLRLISCRQKRVKTKVI